MRIYKNNKYWKINHSNCLFWKVNLPIISAYIPCIEYMTSFKGYDFYQILPLLNLCVNIMNQNSTGKKQIHGKTAPCSHWPGLAPSEPVTTDGMSWDTQVHGSPEPVLTRTRGRDGGTPYWDDVKLFFSLLTTGPQV